MDYKTELEEIQQSLLTKARTEIRGLIKAALGMVNHETSGFVEMDQFCGSAFTYSTTGWDPKAPTKKDCRITDGYRSEGAQEGSAVGEVEYEGKLEAIWESVYCAVRTPVSRSTIWGLGRGVAVQDRTRRSLVQPFKGTPIYYYT